jgi:hypothetical protein
MNSAPQPLTPAQINYAESAQWKEILRQALADLRVAVPGIVQAFDAAKQTAAVQIAIREQVRTLTGPQSMAIAVIHEVPVVLPRAGGFSLTLPVQAGNECLLVFSDMCIDLWWARGGVQDQLERRRHDLADCFCVLGPWSQPWVLSNYSASSAQLRSDDDSVIVDLAASGITLTAPKVQINATGEVDVAPTGKLNLSGSKISVGSLPVYASNLLALAGGLTAGDLFRNGADPDHICVVH